MSPRPFAEQHVLLCSPAWHAVSLTVGKLKLMLERLLRVKAAQQALLLVPPEPSGAQVRRGRGRARLPGLPGVIVHA